MTHIKKWAALCLALMLAVVGISASVAANSSLPQTIRIGLSAHQERDSITIGNSSAVFGYEQNGQFTASGTLQGPLSVQPSALRFVRLDTVYTNFTQAQNAALSLTTAYAASPCFVSPGEWYVYIGGFTSDSEAAAVRNTLGLPSTLMPANTHRVLVSSGGVSALLFDSAYKLQIVGANGTDITIGSRSYRGCVELGRYTNAKLSAVNVLPTEEYLYSVVASEMPSSWHLEALKAQACAARTYSFGRIGHHTAGGYDLCDTTHCQAYTGKGGEAASTREAVEATRGILIYHDNTPIANAVFFSSSGGMTDNSENVWVAAVPYLRSVSELNEPTAKQWSVSFTMAEIGMLLRDRGINIGTVTGVSIDRLENGRVQSLTIKGTNGSQNYTKESIRTLFSLDSRHFTLVNGAATQTPATVSVLQNGTAATAALPSLMVLDANGNAVPVSGLGNTVYAAGADGTRALPVTIQTATSVSGANTITMVGSGWGHGVGMSQHGAKGMAEMGYGFKDILRWYYTGVEVR